MYVRGYREKGVLEVKKLITEHNHPIGPDVSYRKGVGRLKDKIFNKSVGGGDTAGAENSMLKDDGKVVDSSQNEKRLDSENGESSATQEQQGSGRAVGLVELQNMVKSVIPPLTTQLHKGQTGRIGIIGGCQEYTGAPYFAAISALKVGADLSHVFCTRDAAPVIKSYSPELIVHPILDRENAVSEFEKWLPRLHTLVIGPGLGRDPDILKTVSTVINSARSRSIPLVVDADGLFLITEFPDLVDQYETAILTPNAIEFKRLFEKVTGERLNQSSDLVASTKTLAQKLGHVTILRKGLEDIVSDGATVILCSTDGSPRRCGGQGDVLAGSVAAFYNWSLQKNKARSETETVPLGPGVLAGYMACRLIRECGRLAFLQHGRSMVASDLLPFIHPAFEELFS
ncbi:ATP-dependent (S)-NAD(P)H-hydrate dehydratase-like isoform X2 [Babylonia areolata]